MAFTVPVDVANRALQIIGVPRIANFTESSKARLETQFAIDKIRAAELRRSVWTFATRRAVLRPTIATTSNITFDAYDAAVTYAAGDVVFDTNGYLWISTQGSNTGNTPGAGGVNPFWISYFGPVVAQVWDTTLSYFPGDVVYVTGTLTVVYICVLAHSGHTPPNATYWHVLVDATSALGVQFSPLGVNPPTGATTRNLYRLPANYVRLAPQDPKAPAAVRQGLTAGMMYNDWEIENGYIFTKDASPIIFRFVADETDVTLMDNLFCEAWAAQLAIAVCVPLTQSIEKMNTAVGIYREAMGMAKAMNAVEEGSTESEVPEGGQQAQGGQPAGRGQ